MPKKSTANTTGQTETGFFVTYVPYPPCRDAERNIEKPKIENQKLQKSKTDCFVPSCKPSKCVTDPCPEMTCDSYYSVFIGLPATEKLDALKELISQRNESPALKNDGILFLRSNEEIEKFTPEQKTKHDVAIWRYKKESKNEWRGFYVDVLKDCAEISTEHTSPPPTAYSIPIGTSPISLMVSDNANQQAIPPDQRAMKSEPITDLIRETAAVGKQILAEVKKGTAAVEKNTTTNKKGFRSLQQKNYQSLAERVKTLEPPKHENEDENWVSLSTAKTLTSETKSNLNKQRQRGESIPFKQFVVGRDSEGRIWCKVSGTRKFFYLKENLPGQTSSR